MSQLSMNEMTTYRWSFEEDVTNYKAAGIDAIGIWRQKLSDFGEEKGVEMLMDADLKVSNILWAGGFTGSEGRSHQDSIEDGEEAIRLAAAVKADCLIVYSGDRGGHTNNHARRLIVGALVKLASLAGELGVTLAIEPMHAGCAAGWTFLTDVNDALQLIDAVESPHVKLTFDTYHLGFDNSVIERLPEIAPRIAIVHLGDAKSPPAGEQSRCRLGEGNLPLADIVSQLSQAGYHGWYDVELMGEEIEMSDYRELLAHSQKAFSQLTANRR